MFALVEVGRGQGGCDLEIQGRGRSIHWLEREASNWGFLGSWMLPRGESDSRSPGGAGGGCEQCSSLSRGMTG